MSRKLKSVETLPSIVPILRATSPATEFREWGYQRGLFRHNTALVAATDQFVS